MKKLFLRRWEQEPLGAGLDAGFTDAHPLKDRSGARVGDNHPAIAQ